MNIVILSHQDSILNKKIGMFQRYKLGYGEVFPCEVKMTYLVLCLSLENPFLCTPKEGVQCYCIQKTGKVS